jgi:hypothetical protein
MPKLGFELVKTKGRDWWHRPVEDAADSDIMPAMPDDDDDDKSKVTDRKTEYPTLSIGDAPKEIYDYPETGTCIVKYRISRRMMVQKDDGDPKYEVELDIISIDPAPKSNRSSPLERTKSAMADNYRER